MHFITAVETWMFLKETTTVEENGPVAVSGLAPMTQSGAALVGTGEGEGTAVAVGEGDG